MRGRQRYLVLLCLLGIASAFAADWKSSLKESLQSQYGLTKTGWGDYTRITQQGTVYVIQADGINADVATDSTMLVTKIVDGHAEQAKGAAGWLFSKERSRQLKNGERVYLTRIDVKDDGVMFTMITLDTSDLNVKGSTRQTRYKSAVYFPYSAADMQVATAANIKKDTDLIFRSEAEANTHVSKTIQLGQSPDEVQKILGVPDKTVELGPKTIFIYKDMKVVFTDKKVTDVQ